jgi:segregation and condensation protein B
MIKEENINCTVEALVLASPEPVSLNKLTEVLDGVSPARIRQAVGDLNNLYMGAGISFRIREVAGGYQVHILPDFEQVIKNMLSKQRTVRLTRAALETLAIIAYKQPATKTEIEHIRGVSSDGVLHNLLERKLIVIAGRSEGPGRPLLYKTSSEFLKFFGLNRLTDLPRIEEIEEMIREAEPSRDQTELNLPEDANGLLKGVLDDDKEGDQAADESDDMVAHAEVGIESPGETDVEMPDPREPIDDDDDREDDEQDDEVIGADRDPELISEIASGPDTRDDDSEDGGNGNGNGSGSSTTRPPHSDDDPDATDDSDIRLSVRPRLSAMIYLPGEDTPVDTPGDDSPPEVSLTSSSHEENIPEASPDSDRQSIDE